MLKVGVLGSGFMGGTHARAYAKIPDVQVIGVSALPADKDKAEVLATEVGAKVYTDAMELATLPEVDAISITLPTNLHRDYALAAMEAGKAVFCEKPMGLSVAECDEMIAASEKTGQLLMVAHVMRFWPEYLALVAAIKSGDYGKPLAAKASRLSARPRWGEWFAKPEWTGGGLLDLQIHDLDALNWLFGKPESVYSRGQQGIPGAWDHVFTLLDYGDVQAFAEGSVMMPDGYPFTMSLWVLCEKASLEFTFRAGGTGVETGTDTGTTLLAYETGKDPVALTAAGEDGYEAEVAYFVACVREGAVPDRGTMEQGRLAVATALAARESLETDQVVKL
jgi:predicted dehydrogenase